MPPISLDSPVPNNASIIILYSLSSGFVINGTSRFLAMPICLFVSSVALSLSPARNMLALKPASLSILAHAIPSPPLLPMPQIASTFIFTGSILL